jgi:hypothetical protein
MKKKMDIYSLATTEVCQSPGWNCKQEEGNNPMNYATATVQASTTETQDQRKYLEKRLQSVFYEKDAPLYADFGLRDDDPPSTPEELEDRIKAGRFIIRGKKTDAGKFDDDDDVYYGYGGWASLIRWRDPAKKADLDGYENAKTALGNARQEAMDIVKIKDVEAGLEAVKALKDWKPTPAAT